jgi:hypothetical protein
VVVTGSVTLGLIATAVFGQASGKDEDLNPAPRVVARVVVSSPGPLSGLAPFPAVDPQGGNPQTSQTIDNAATLVQQTLALSQAPNGLSEYIADLRSKTKYRLGNTPLTQRLLARGIAERQVAKNQADPNTLNAAVQNVTKGDVEGILKDQFARMTGLTPPDNPQLFEKHIKDQNAKAIQVLNASGQSLTLGSSLTPLQTPLPSMPTFNWTMKGFVDANSGIVTAVQDQTKANCSPGCCWAFATVGAFEAAYALQNRVFINASEQYLLNCARAAMVNSPDPLLSGQQYSCAGGWWAFSVLSSQDVSNPGLPTRIDMPYTGIQVACPASINKPYQADTWSYVLQNTSLPTKEQLKAALCDHGPLVVAVFGNQVWINNDGAVINDPTPAPTPSGLPSVNHAVVLVGWDDTKQAWMIKNSWGTGYGIPDANGVGTGFLYIAYGTVNLGYSAAYVVAATRNP